MGVQYGSDHPHLTYKMVTDKNLHLVELIRVVPNGEDDIDEGIRGEVCRKVSVSFDVVFT